MAVVIQYDLFEDQNELSEVKKDIEFQRLQLDKYRKSLFAKDAEKGKALNQLLTMILEQQEEIAKLKTQMIKLTN